MADSPFKVTDEVFNSSVFEEGGSLVVDLSNVQEAKFELIPKGFHNAIIDSWDFGPSKNSGQPTFQVVYSLPDFGEGKAKVFDNFSFSQKALPFTKAKLAAFAPELVNGKFDPQKIAESGVMIGRPVRLQITHQDYEGEPRARVSKVLPPQPNGAAGAAQSGAQPGGKFFG
jgi:hypothetical protein